MRHDPPLKLGYLVPEFPGQTHVFFWREIKALRASGVDVALVSTRRPTVPCAHDFADQAASETTYLFPPSWGNALVELMRRPGGVLRGLGYIAKAKGGGAKAKCRLLAMLGVAAYATGFAKRESITHLHAHSCADAAHLCAMVRALGGPTYSLTLHGDLEVYGSDHRLKFGKASFVSAVTAALREQIVELDALDPIDVPVLWMGVDTNRFTPENKDDTGPMRMITVARLQANKGHRFALRAIRRLIDEGVDLRYDLVGAGPDREAIEAEIAELQLGDYVKLLGTMGEDEVLALLRGSDVFVLPSVGLGEACPVSVMEAMSCGLPVVCSVIGGVPDMYEHGKEGYLVKQEDVEGLAAAFGELAASQAARRAMGRAGRERAKQVFDAMHNAERLLGLLRGERQGVSS